MLTGGYLSKLVLLATAVGSGRVRNREDLEMIRFLGKTERSPLLQLAADVGIFEQVEPFRLSNVGKQVELAYLETRDSALPFRMILSEYIRRTLPPWAFRMPSGRMEMVATLSQDVTACFHSAGLLNATPDESIVHWWSEMAEFIRTKIGERREETGRSGELKSLQYERDRTGLEPKWIAFETNFAGYDILTVDSAERRNPRRIEVKTSEAPVSRATFFVTENEWKVASFALDSYRFHLWSMDSVPLLADIPALEVKPHIPENNSEGRWKSVEIPFSAFSSQFITIDD